jgi:hypothetical protein
VLGEPCREDFGGGGHGGVQFDAHAHGGATQIESGQRGGEDATLYRKLIGNLRYLVHTRPDLIFTVEYFSHFIQWPTVEHIAALKRVLRYIACMIDYGCFYQRGSCGVNLFIYNDSDYAGDVNNSHSTSGVLFFIGSSLVSWYSLKQ